MAAGVYIDGGTVSDSLTGKSIPSAKVLLISSGDTILINANQRGKLSSGNYVKGTPDSVTVISNMSGYHVSYFRIKTVEHGKETDSTGQRNQAQWFTVELTISLAKD